MKSEVPSEDYDGIRPNNGFRGGGGGGGGGGGQDEYGGFHVDDVAAREMAAYGLPTSFSMGNNSMAASMHEAPSSSNTSKGEKKTFYCELW